MLLDVNFPSFKPDDNCSWCTQEDKRASEAEAAAGMTQLAASGRSPASGSSLGGNHAGALHVLGNALISLARRIPLEVRHEAC
jgi:hypothetical protein